MVSIILALYLRVKKEPYLLNLILGLVVLPPMLLFGSFQFFMGEDYSDAAVISVAETVDFSLPQDLKTATSYLYGCAVTQAKIESEEEKASFLASVQESELWAETLGTRIKNALPYMFSYHVEPYDYFLFYNITEDTYNIYPDRAGEYEAILIAYDEDLGRLLIFSQWRFREVPVVEG